MIPQHAFEIFISCTGEEGNFILLMFAKIHRSQNRPPSYRTSYPDYYSGPFLQSHSLCNFKTSFLVGQRFERYKGRCFAVSESRWFFFCNFVLRTTVTINLSVREWNNCIAPVLSEKEKEIVQEMAEWITQLLLKTSWA